MTSYELYGTVRVTSLTHGNCKWKTGGLEVAYDPTLNAWSCKVVFDRGVSHYGWKLTNNIRAITYKNKCLRLELLNRATIMMKDLGISPEPMIQQIVKIRDESTVLVPPVSRQKSTPTTAAVAQDTAATSVRSDESVATTNGALSKKKVTADKHSHAGSLLVNPQGTVPGSSEANNIQNVQFDEEPDLTQSNSFSDLTLIVEDKKLYFSRRLLCLVSPVFKLMFSSDYREKSASELPLPGKTFKEIHALLRWILPSVRCNIEDDNVMLLLPLSEEYQIKILQEECVDFLIRNLESKKPCADTCLETLAQAELYQVGRLTTAVADYLSRFENSQLMLLSRYTNLTPETRVALLQKRLEVLERCVRALSPYVPYSSHFSRPNITDCLDKCKMFCERDLTLLDKNSTEVMKTNKIIEEIIESWEYGENSSCTAHLNASSASTTRCKRDFTCSQCTQLFGFTLQTKLRELSESDACYGDLNPYQAQLIAEDMHRYQLSHAIDDFC